MRLLNCAIRRLQPATQFMTEAFSVYTRLSDANIIFGQQMKYMQGMTVFYKYNIFVFMILGFTILAAIYFSIWPSDRCVGRILNLLPCLRRMLHCTLRVASQR